jgi:uncharacterized protein with HEPN domain
MPSDINSVSGRLSDIVDNIQKAEAFVTGLTQSQFVEDDRTVYAVTRALEIISEASRHLPEDVKARHPGIAWQRIKAAGNIYRHEYRGVDLNIVWDTVLNELEPLKIAATAELKRLNEKPL